jgi:hypothetical protein
VGHTWKVTTVHQVLRRTVGLCHLPRLHKLWRRSILFLKYVFFFSFHSLYIIFSDVCVCVCVCVCVYLYTCMCVPKNRGVCLIPWGWSYSQLWAAKCRCWETNSAPWQPASVLNCWAVWAASPDLIPFTKSQNLTWFLIPDGQMTYLQCNLTILWKLTITISPLDEYQLESHILEIKKESHIFKVATPYSLGY